MTDMQRHEKEIEHALTDIGADIGNLSREYARRKDQESLQALHDRLLLQTQLLSKWSKQVENSLVAIGSFEVLRRSITSPQLQKLSLAADPENTGGWRYITSKRSKLAKLGLVDPELGEVTQRGHAFLAFMEPVLLPGFTESHFEFEWAGWKFNADACTCSEHHNRKNHTLCQILKGEGGHLSDVRFAIRLAKECCGLPGARSLGQGDIIPLKNHNYQGDLSGFCFSRVVYIWHKACLQAGGAHAPLELKNT